MLCRNLLALPVELWGFHTPPPTPSRSFAPECIYKNIKIISTVLESIGFPSFTQENIWLSTLHTTFYSILQMANLEREKALKKLVSKLRLSSTDKMQDTEETFVAKLKLSVSDKAVKCDAFDPALPKNIMQAIDNSSYSQRVKRELKNVLKQEFGCDHSGNDVRIDAQGNFSVFLMDHVLESTCDGKKSLAFAVFEWNFGPIKIPDKALGFIPWSRNEITVKENEMIEKWCRKTLYDNVSQKCTMLQFDETHI